MLNLLAAIVLSNFTEMCKQEAFPITPQQVEDYAEAWSLFDPEGSNKIDVKLLPKLLAEIPAPLGFADSDTDEAAIENFIKKQLSFQDTVEGEKIHYVEVFLELAKFQYGRKEIVHIEQFMLKRVALIASGAFPCLHSPPTLSIYEMALVLRVQSKFRRKLKAKGWRIKKDGEAALELPGADQMVECALTPKGTKLIKHSPNPVWFGKSDEAPDEKGDALDENVGALGDLAVHPELLHKTNDGEPDKEAQGYSTPRGYHKPSATEDNDLDIALEKHAPRWVNSIRSTKQRRH